MRGCRHFLNLLLLLGIAGAPHVRPSECAAAATTAAVESKQTPWLAVAPPGDPVLRDPRWTTVHALADGVVGVIAPDPHAAAAGSAVRFLAPYDSDGDIYLVSARWRERAGAALPPEAVRELASDGAQALVLAASATIERLAAWGCRWQRLGPPAVGGAAPRGPATVAGPSREPADPGEPPRASMGPGDPPRASSGPGDPSRRPAGPDAGSFGTGRPLEETPALWSALVPAVNTGRLARDLDTLSTGLGTRHSYTPEMVLATQYVYDTFAGLGLEASFDPFTYNGRSLRNVLGIKPGLTEPDRIVVVVGHLDSTSPDPANSAPGADDNASGAIAVLEAARLLAPLPTARTIYFLAVSAEEQGLIGSAHFAAAAAAAGLGIEAVLNLDMVGYHEPEGADLWLEGFHYGVSSAWLMELLGENAETYAGLAIYLYPGEGFGSDHVPFHNHGFPAILSIENEWDDFPCYHQTCDTAEWVNPWLWRGITAANAITAAQLAGLEAGTGAVEGTVLVPEGLDASGVTLRLEGTGYPGRQTGLSGAFAWEAVFPGRYLLRAERTGCLPVEMEIEVPSGESVPVEVVLPRDPAAGPDGDVAAAPAVRLTVAPNPTPRGAAIHLDLAQPATGRLEIFAADGRRMATLVAGELPAGAHRLLWDGRDTAGRRAAAGTYWVRWSASNGDIVRRVIRAG